MSAPIVHEWLYQVERDLMSARNCAHAPEPTLDRAAFFVQQAAEKLVKAVLLEHGIEPRRTHDIGALAGRVPGDYPAQIQLSGLHRFTDFVAAFRYSSEQGEEAFPTVSEIDAWIAEIEALKADFESWLGERPSAGKGGP
jgi:HEPN domain-containing protein